MVTVRKVHNYFFEYLKASIVDLTTLLSSSVQNSEGSCTATGAIVVLSPAKNLNNVFGGF